MRRPFFAASSLAATKCLSEGLSISVWVTSDEPIIVERPMYFDFNGMYAGGHDVVGYMP